MPVINIGKEYKDAFVGICKLKQSGCIPDDVVYSATLYNDGGVIESRAYKFVYSDRGSAAETEKEKISFTKDGASWFAALRGEAYADGLADWKKLISEVAECYHKKYAFTEFKQTAIPEGEIKQGEENIKKIAWLFFRDRLFKNENEVNVNLSNGKESNEDIYCASLRVNLSGGTGAAVPVLAKVYFKAERARWGGGIKLVPILKDDAEQMDAFLQNAFCESSDISGEADGNISATTDLMVNAIDDLLKKGNNSFGRCICFSGEKDLEVVGGMLSQGSHNDMKLECTSVSLLGMSHVSWKSTTFRVNAGEGRPVLRAVLGLNGTITMYCENCNKKLIDNNVITIEGGSAEKIRIDPRAEGLGLTNEQIDKIKQSKVFSSHHQMLCEGNIARIGRECQRRVCGENTVNLGTEESPVFKCKNCPYPEVVYWDGYDKRYDPTQLTYAYDLMRLVEKDKTGICSCCKKTFTKNALRGNKCDFCRNADGVSEDDAKKAKKLYSHYCHVFSPFTRLFNIGRRKLCFERYDIILFTIGNKKYVFDKSQLERDGYLKRPKRIN